MSHAQAKQQGAQCDRCPLNNCGRGPVFGNIVPDAILALVAEAPDKNEVEQGKVLVGYSGRDVEYALKRGGLQRHQVTLTNCLLCQPTESLLDYIRKLSPGTPNPLDCCRPRLERDLLLSNSKTELAVGGVALQQLARVRGLSYGTAAKIGKDQARVLPIAKQRGAPLLYAHNRVLCASYHPAYAMRDKPYKHVVQEDITRAANIARRGIDWSLPKFHLSPNLLEIERLCRLLIEHKQHTLVSMDIETDGIKFWECKIRCVGFAANIEGEELVFVVPLRKRNNDLWWLQHEHKRIEHVLREVLEQCTLVGHNLAFDTAILLRAGLIREKFRNRLYEDTMIMHHDTHENDLPHNLGFVTSRHFEIPMWKKDVDTKHVAGVEDIDLHHYNALDVLTVLRLAPILKKQIQRLNTTAQYQTDLKLAVATRNMGELGLVVDMKVREKLSKELNITCNKLRADFQRLVGKSDINPRSTHQLRRWLFTDLGLMPTLNTAGYEWDSEAQEDPATSVQAIIKILDRGVSKEIEQALNTLLEYRAYDKLRGTYVDNLPYRAVDWEEYGITAGPELSLLHTNWKVHVTPTGRLASQPNVQNWSSRGKVNVLTMITSPPGHVIVGADMDQLELRIYASVSGDQKLLQAFEEGLDPHAMNAATLFASNDQEVQKVYEQIVAWKKSTDPKLNKKAKNLRNVSKRFAFLECLSQDTPILTDTGLIPIQDVQAHHEVWDGVEWVTHDGVIYKGIKDVITYQGLTATPDHEVWLADGRKVPFIEAAEGRHTLAWTGAGAQPLRYVTTTSRKQETSNTQFVLEETDYKTTVAAISAAYNQAALQRAKKRTIQKLRRVRNQVQFLARRVCRTLKLRVWEFALCFWARKQREAPQYAFAGNIDASARQDAQRGLSKRPVSGYTLQLLDDDDNTCGTFATERRTQLSFVSSKAHVYDIVNAGPRRRFTAAGVLVSNCYGGEPDTLYATMSTDRDKATGKRMFPDLDPAQVLKWHDAWHFHHPETKRWHLLCHEAEREHGCIAVPMLDHRKRFFPGGATKKNSIPNMQIQGSAASMMNKSLLEINERIPHRGWSKMSGLVLQVHDYLGVYVPEERAEEAKIIVEEAMNSEWRGMEMTAAALITKGWADQ